MHYITRTHTRSGGEIRMHAENAYKYNIPSRTQTRSSNRSPSFEYTKEEVSQGKFVKLFKKHAVNLSMSSCIWEIEEHRRALGKSTKMKNYILFIWKSIEKILFISVWHLVRILSKITCTASRCIVSLESSSINTKVIFLFKYMALPALFISSLQMSRIWNIIVPPISKSRNDIV